MINFILRFCWGAKPFLLAARKILTIYSSYNHFRSHYLILWVICLQTNFIDWLLYQRPRFHVLAVKEWFALSFLSRTQLQLQTFACQIEASVTSLCIFESFRVGHFLSPSLSSLRIQSCRGSPASSLHSDLSFNELFSLLFGFDCLNRQWSPSHSPRTQSCLRGDECRCDWTDAPKHIQPHSPRSHTLGYFHFRTHPVPSSQAHLGSPRE